MITTFELPLFPLNTVLFPRTPLPLHIFEPRYKQMINACIDDQQPFGVVLIEQGEEAGGTLAQPHQVGCIAQIQQVERLADGRIFIMTIGTERFKTKALRYNRPYLVGEVERYPLENPNEDALVPDSQQLLRSIQAYAQILSQMSEEAFELQQLPEDPLLLGYLGAYLLQIPSDQKQTLLEAENALEFLTQLNTLYKREIPLLKAMLTYESGKGSTGLHSLN